MDKLVRIAPSSLHDANAYGRGVEQARLIRDQAFGAEPGQ